jgi:hypothetical protein
VLGRAVWRWRRSGSGVTGWRDGAAHTYQVTRPPVPGCQVTEFANSVRELNVHDGVAAAMCRRAGSFRTDRNGTLHGVVA